MTKRKGCNCLKSMNEQLAPMGAALTTGFLIDWKNGNVGDTPPALLVHRIGKGRKKLPTIYCSHCPCCGKKYPAAHMKTTFHDGPKEKKP